MSMERSKADHLKDLKDAGFPLSEILSAANRDHVDFVEMLRKEKASDQEALEEYWNLLGVKKAKKWLETLITVKPEIEKKLLIDHMFKSENLGPTATYQLVSNEKQLATMLESVETSNST